VVPRRARRLILRPTDASDKTTTEPEQKPHSLRHSKCAIYVPRDLPESVAAGLRSWHSLPRQIRKAVEALLR
jgi:hypothetical protein